MYRLGECLIDPATRRITRGSETVRLSPKAMQVLAALTDAHGEVVSRGALLDQAWPGVTVGEEVLTHAIAELRKAFGDSSRQPRYIETVHKSGYRLLLDASAPSPSTAPSDPDDVAADGGGVGLQPTDRDPSASGPDAAPPPATAEAAASLQRPSIAVLAFTNMSGDPGQEYFADGMTEDIITDLSRFRSLAVIARHSSFSFKGRPVTAQQVAGELGVDYVVEGSLRRAGIAVRINASSSTRRAGTISGPSATIAISRRFSPSRTRLSGTS